MKRLLFILLMTGFSLSGFSQVGINTTNPNAQLDIKSSNQAAPSNTDGILIPKIDAFPVVNPTTAQESMLVYLNMVSAGKQPGFYYWDNATTSWKGLGGDKGWDLPGNTVSDTTKFVGTINSTDLIFKSDNHRGGRIGTTNTSIGRHALNPMAFGTDNSAFGKNALNASANGNGNSALGAGALKSTTDGNHNTASGFNSLFDNTTGGENTALGFNAMRTNIGGFANTAVGSQALYGNKGSNNVGIGYFAGSNISTGSGNIAIGLNAAIATPTGSSQLTIANSIFGTDIGDLYNAKIGVGINAPSAKFEIASPWNPAAPSNTDGILIPRVSALAATGVMTAAQNSMLVYLTTASGGRQPGFYYWDNTGTPQWRPLSASIPNGTAVGNTMYWNGATWVNNSSFLFNDGTNVGVNTAAPSSIFTVRQTGIGVTQEDPTGAAKIGFYTSTGNAWVQTHSDMDLSFTTNNGATQMLLQKTTGNLGINVLIPTEKLEVDGKTKTTNLQITNNAGANRLLVSDALGNGTWTASASLASGTLDQAYDFGGAGLGRTITADAGAVTIAGVDGLVSTGTFGSGVVVPTGGGTRMVWNPRKAAFRVGSVGNQWNDTNVGNYSVAFGSNTTASGLVSTAFGSGTIASGDSATAFGGGTEASYNYATAFGQNTTASGWASTAFGIDTSAFSPYSTAFGQNTTASAAIATAFGSGTTASGGYSTAFGLGTTASGGYATAFGSGSSASGHASTAFGRSSAAPSYGETVIGIGATIYSPSVNGTYQFAAANAADRLFVIGNAIDANVNDIVDPTERRNAMVVLKNGNTAIGNIIPSLARLQVEGAVGNTVATFNGSTNSQGVSIVSDWPGVYFNSYYSGGTRSMSGSGYASIVNTDQTNGGLIFQTTNVANTAVGSLLGTIPTRMTITGSGNVGIGTPTPGGLFELSIDQGRKPGTSTWTVTSDERLKTIHGNYTKGLEDILKLQPITYNYVNSGKRIFDEKVLQKEFSGFSAQEVQKFFPEAVGVDDDGFLNFNMHPILVAFVNAFKELDAKNKILQIQLEQIKTQQEEINSLKAINSEILKRLENLEKK